MCRDCKSHKQAPQSWTQKSTTLFTLHRSHTVWEWNHPGLRLPLRVAVRHPDPLMMTTNTGFTIFISEGRSATLQARSSICNRILLFSPKQHLLCLDSRTGPSPGQAETTASHFLEGEVAGSCSSSCLWATDPKLASAEGDLLKVLCWEEQAEAALRAHTLPGREDDPHPWQASRTCTSASAPHCCSGTAAPPTPPLPGRQSASRCPQDTANSSTPTWQKIFNGAQRFTSLIKKSRKLPFRKASAAKTLWREGKAKRALWSPFIKKTAPL